MRPPINPSQVFFGDSKISLVLPNSIPQMYAIMSLHITKATGNRNLCVTSHTPSIRARCSADLPDDAFKYIVNEIVRLAHDYQQNHMRPGELRKLEAIVALSEIQNKQHNPKHIEQK